ncbi:hypothetical protein [Commensalibacter papalotli (ex Botero et al. 2024)]|uniref:YdgA family protein n=1 Tax=Commensalibacter papalotli (ex Botero et al. 2024) TaxID=2972766 RepID=A0ABN8W8G9_9PROT|nr:hypothetical protein [Commensalibacter papalotli (ex Botero et al. 2024)]CAI3922552.1 unnamed protein product [Commensalibacter papalotli (ex Botero et al. 2024)]CAI3929623.1 unnamed protein product [Commensalibacter papalotli (ex Botero et al. 2024)]
MSKAAVVGAVVIIGVGVVGGGGYYYMSNKANQELQNTISLIEKSAPGLSIKYESSSVSPFSQSATLQKLIIKDKDGQEYTADTLTLSGVSDGKVDTIAVDKFHTEMQGGKIDAAHIDVKNLDVPTGAIIVEDGKIKKIYPSKISFDLLNIQNASAFGPDKTGGTFAQYELKNYGLKRNSDQVLKQVDVKATTDGKEFLKLNQVQVNGLDLAGIIELVEQGQKPRAISGQPSKGTLEGLTAHVDDQDWSLDKFETDNSVAANGDLKSSAVFSGFKVSTAHNARLFLLKEMGYDQIDVSGNISGNYIKAKQEWSFTPFDISIKDVGNLNANMQFTAPEDLSNVDPQEVMSSYKLISLKVTLQNKGLLEKIFAKTAKEKNITADQAKENIVTMIKQDAQTATIPVQKQGDEAFIALINDPKQSLVIQVKPAQPVTALELMGKSQSEILDALNLSIKAEATK